MNCRGFSSVFAAMVIPLLVGACVGGDFGPPLTSMPETAADPQATDVAEEALDGQDVTTESIDDRGVIVESDSPQEEVLQVAEPELCWREDALTQLEFQPVSEESEDSQILVAIYENDKGQTFKITARHLSSEDSDFVLSDTNFIQAMAGCFEAIEGRGELFEAGPEGATPVPITGDSIAVDIIWLDTLTSRYAWEKFSTGVYESAADGERQVRFSEVEALLDSWDIFNFALYNQPVLLADVNRWQKYFDLLCSNEFILEDLLSAGGDWKWPESFYAWRSVWPHEDDENALFAEATLIMMERRLVNLDDNFCSKISDVATDVVEKVELYELDGLIFGRVMEDAIEELMENNDISEVEYTIFFEIDPDFSDGVLTHRYCEAGDSASVWVNVLLDELGLYLSGPGGSQDSAPQIKVPERDSVAIRGAGQGLYHARVVGATSNAKYNIGGLVNSNDRVTPTQTCTRKLGT